MGRRRRQLRMRRRGADVRGCGVYCRAQTYGRYGVTRGTQAETEAQ